MSQRGGRGRGRGMNPPARNDGQNPWGQKQQPQQLQQQPAGVWGRPQAPPQQAPPQTAAPQQPGPWGARPQQAPPQQAPPQTAAPQQPGPWGARPQQAPPQPSCSSVGEPDISRLNIAPVPAISAPARRVAREGGEPSPRGAISRRGHDDVRTRPETCDSKKGTSGTPVQVQANYYQMLTKPKFALHQYRVDFEPEEERTVVKIGILRSVAAKLDPYTFDGAALFTVRRYNPDPFIINASRRTQNGEEPIKITIKFTNVLSTADPQYIQFFNIVMRKCIASLDLQLVGRDFYDALAKTTITNFNFDVWPGILTSIKQHESHILMNVDITHKVMRNETAYDFLRECMSRAGNRGDYRALYADLLGKTVITLYNNKTYRIDDIDYDSTVLSTFRKKDQDVTFKKYYEERYQLRIRFNDQPLLVSRPTSRDIRGGRNTNILLIPELCNLTGLSENMRADQSLMRALADHTRIKPDVRMSKYSQFLNRINSNATAQKELKTWDLEFSRNLVTFNARVLPKEEILFGNNSKGTANHSLEWSLRNQSQFRPIPIQRWAVIVPSKLANACSNFVRTLANAAKSLNYKIPDLRALEQIRDDRASSYVEAIDKVLNDSPDIIVLVVPNNRSDRYSMIKRKCCIDRPVASQVVLAKNLDGKNTLSIATKIAIQMNCKLGGAPWTLNLPFSVPTMIAGYDVCHDTVSKGKSFGALVTTYDRNFTKYYSNVMSHNSGEELSNFLGQQMCAAVCAFKQKTGVLPVRIFFYRDGVGEGNLAYVHTHEVGHIKKLLKAIYGEQEVLMTVIIVSKRISTRIFQNNNNPTPGTVVDDCITLPDKYDFFLVSQFVKQGTVTPTSYNVIADNSNMKPDLIQRMTYKLCHMYYNWSGTVRVPAPCQYAHKLAFLTGQHLHASPSQKISDLLFFL